MWIKKCLAQICLIFIHSLIFFFSSFPWLFHFSDLYLITLKFPNFSSFSRWVVTTNASGTDWLATSNSQCRQHSNSPLWIVHSNKRTSFLQNKAMQSSTPELDSPWLVPASTVESRPCCRCLSQCYLQSFVLRSSPSVSVWPSALHLPDQLHHCTCRIMQHLTLYIHN